MTATQLHEHLVNANHETLLLDVREEWEYQLCHINNSLLIPMSDIIHKHHEFDMQQETVVICHHGIRSRQIGRFLESQNFTNIINLNGGVEAWAKSVDKTMHRY